MHTHPSPVSWNLKARWKQWNTRSADLVELRLVGKFSRQACRTILVVTHLPHYIDNMYIVCLVPRSDISVVENKIGCVYTRLIRITNDARCTREIKSRNAMSTEHSRRSLCRQQIRLQFKEKLVKFYIWSIPLLYADTWTLRTLKVLKCVAGEGLRRSVEPTAWKMKKYYVESEERNILHAIPRLVTSCIGIVFSNLFLKER